MQCNPMTTNPISRRTLLQSLAGLGALALPRWQARAGETPNIPGAANLVSRENEQPGTREWMLQKTGVDPVTKYRCPGIEGYCSRTSVRAGEKIRFHVSTNPPSPFRLDIYPVGERHLLLAHLAGRALGASRETERP